MLVVFCLINRNITTFCAHMLRRPFCRHGGKESNAPAVSFRQFIKCQCIFLQLPCNGNSWKRFIHFFFFSMWNLIVMAKIYTVYNSFLDFGNAKSIKRNLIFSVKVKDKWSKISKLYHEYIFQEKDECLINLLCLSNHDLLYHISKMKFYSQSSFIPILRRLFLCH